MYNIFINTKLNYYIQPGKVNQHNQRLITMITSQEFKFIVEDEFGDSLRAFYTKEEAESFISLRPECKIVEIKSISLQEFDDIYGDPPF